MTVLTRLKPPGLDQCDCTCPPCARAVCPGPGRGVLTPPGLSGAGQTQRHTFLCLEFSLSDITTLLPTHHTPLHSSSKRQLYFMF